jgi:hypothetical protein
MNDTDRRPATDLWNEIVRTAALIRGYEPMLEKVRERLLFDRLTGDDARNLTEIVSDAQILVGLIEELDRRRGSALG